MKKGFTILELLISILLVSTVLLLLLRVMVSLETINHDTSYASDDEIGRTKMIKNIEESFLDNNLNGISISKDSDKTIITFMMNENKTLEISTKSIEFDGEVYTLKSSNANYDTCISYEYETLEDDYYLVTFVIPVLIDGKNTTSRDDYIITYIGLRNEFTSFPPNYAC